MAWLDCPSLDDTDPDVFDALAAANVPVRTVGSTVQCWGVADAQASAIVAAYDPAPRARAEAVERVQAERRARGAAVLDPDPDARFMTLWHAVMLVALPTLFGQPLDASAQAQAQQLLALAVHGRAIEAAAVAIAARVSAMDAPSAAAFDPSTAPEWPG